MRSSKRSWKSEEPSAAKDADQVEFNAMRTRSATLDEAMADEVVSGELDDDIEEMDQEGPVWKRQDLAKEEIVDATRKEIERRQSLLGPYYPFELQSNKLVYKQSTTGFYEFCLAISCAGNITAGGMVKLPRVFERAAAYLLKLYLGRSAKMLHTGFPRTPSTSFRQVMSKLNTSFEWNWNPKGVLGARDEGDVQDETLDFVITLKPLDKRAGSLYVLGQCACGDDWNSKLRDPDLVKIKRWFHPPWLVPPVRAFTTPFAMGDRTIEKAVDESQAIVFDRTRLVSIAESGVHPRSQHAMRNFLSPITELV